MTMAYKHEYSEAMGSYTAQRLNEAIQSARRRSTLVNGANQEYDQIIQKTQSAPEDLQAVEERHRKFQEQRHRLELQEQRQQRERHDEKMNHVEADHHHSDHQQSNKDSHSHRKLPATPGPNVSRESDRDMIDDDINEDDGDDDDESSEEPDEARSDFDSLGPETAVDEEADQFEQDLGRWSSRSDAEIESRLENLPMNQSKNLERIKSGREMVEEHTSLVEAYKARTRQRLGLRGSNGEQRCWSR